MNVLLLLMIFLRATSDAFSEEEHDEENAIEVNIPHLITSNSSMTVTTDLGTWPISSLYLSYPL